MMPARVMSVEEFRRQRHEHLVRSTGIPGRAALLLAQGEAAPLPQTLEAVEDGRNVFLYGPKGRGKTVTAAATAYGYLDAHTHQMAQGGSCTFYADALPVPTGAAKKRIRVRFTTSSAYLAAVRRTFDDSSKAVRDEVERLEGCALLVLDDLGKESYRASDWSMLQIWRLLDRRYAAKLPTVVTSQYDPERLPARLSGGFPERLEDAGAAVDRLLEGAYVLGFDGPVRREGGWS